jgi:hypothetical protein
VAEVCVLERLPAQLCPDLLDHAPELLALLAATVDRLIWDVRATGELEVSCEAGPKLRSRLLGIDEVLAGDQSIELITS